MIVSHAQFRKKHSPQALRKSSYLSVETKSYFPGMFAISVFFSNRFRTNLLKDFVGTVCRDEIKITQMDKSQLAIHVNQLWVTHTFALHIHPYKRPWYI